MERTIRSFEAFKPGLQFEADQAAVFHPFLQQLTDGRKTNPHITKRRSHVFCIQ